MFNKTKSKQRSNPLIIILSAQYFFCTVIIDSHRKSNICINHRDGRVHLCTHGCYSKNGMHTTKTYFSTTVNISPCWLHKLRVIARSHDQNTSVGSLSTVTASIPVSSNVLLMIKCKNLDDFKTQTMIYILWFCLLNWATWFQFGFGGRWRVSGASLPGMSLKWRKSPKDFLCMTVP